MSVQISVVGTVATAPKLFATAGKSPFCTFRVASNERRFDREKNEWVDGETTWMSVNAFRSLAEHAQQSFSVGDRVIVNGKLRVKRWENQDRKGLSVELDADGLGHDLRWGVSKFTKRIVGAAAAEGSTDAPPESVPGGFSNADSNSWIAPVPPSEPEIGDGFTPPLEVAAA